MEITWTYNWLETIGFLVLIVFGGLLLVRGLLILWIAGKFKGWWR